MCDFVSAGSTTSQGKSPTATLVRPSFATTATVVHIHRSSTCGTLHPDLTTNSELNTLLREPD